MEQTPGPEEIVLVTANRNDPATTLIQSLSADRPDLRVTLVEAGTSRECGEKVHNLLAALDAVPSSCEILVFADSDIRPPSDWLKHLVAPLALSPNLGATTGYRWYLPSRNNLPGIIRSAWNAGIVSLISSSRRNFCWGGSMAIRRETFDRIHVRDYWKHSISDDYSMTQALHDNGLQIQYVPQCLIPSMGRTTWRDMVEWSTRQLIITKVYFRHLWRLALVSQTLFAVTMLSGIGLLVSNPSPGVSRWTAVALSLICLCGFVRGFLRWLAIRRVLSSHRENLNRYAWAYIFLPPLISLFTAFTLWRSARTSQVRWSGHEYEIHSPTEMTVLK